MLIFPYAARVLAPEGIGKAQFIFLLSQYIALLAALGIPIYGAREVARLRSQPAALSGLLRALLLLNGLTGLVLFLLFAGCALWLPQLAPNQTLYLTGSLLILFSFTSVEWAYTGLEIFRQMALRSVFIKTLSLLCLFIWVRSPADLQFYLSLQVGSLLLYNFLNLSGLLPHLKKQNISLHLKSHIKPLLLIFGTTIASTLYTTFDSILLGFLATDAAVGYYTAATKIAKISLPLVMAYGAVSLPAITVAIKEENTTVLADHLQKSYAYITSIGAPISVGLFAFAKPLVLLFSGDAFGPAILTLRLLAPMPLLIGLGYFWGYQVALPLGREKVLLYAALLGMVVSVVGNLLLVPLLQQDGAAISGIAAELAVTIVYYAGVKNQLHVPDSFRVLFQSIGASLPFLVALLLPGNQWSQHFFLWLALLGGISLLLYVLLQLFFFRNPVLRSLLSRYIPSLRASVS